MATVIADNIGNVTGFQDAEVSMSFAYNSAGDLTHTVSAAGALAGDGGMLWWLTPPVALDYTYDGVGRLETLKECPSACAGMLRGAAAY